MNSAVFAVSHESPSCAGVNGEVPVWAIFSSPFTFFLETGPSGLNWGTGGVHAGKVGGSAFTVCFLGGGLVIGEGDGLESSSSSSSSTSSPSSSSTCANLGAFWIARLIASDVSLCAFLVSLPVWAWRVEAPLQINAAANANKVRQSFIV